MRGASRTTSTHFRCAWLASLGLACGDPEIPADVTVAAPEIVINEIVADNEGVILDELGEADDYIEFANASSRPLNLANYRIIHEGRPYALPDLELAPGAVRLFWADSTPEQGSLHLPFRISRAGTTLGLESAGGQLLERVHVPPLEEHQAYLRLPDSTGSFRTCGWATPNRPNGEHCGPVQLPELPEDFKFAPFTWPEVWPEPPAPLAINEAALRPAAFVEIVNTSAESVALGDYSLGFARHEIGERWPGPSAGEVASLPDRLLAPGDRVVVSIQETHVAQIEQEPEFEGVLTIWQMAEERAIDRVDFMSWPEGAVLARVPDASGRYRFCENRTLGASNSDCVPLASRAVGDRVRRLLTPGDFHALAAGRSALGTDSVEFLLDLEGGGVVTFINSANYDLHYTFVREAIEKEPPLNRCDPLERQLFTVGWYAFSEREYFRVEGRRYLLGTLVRHAGSGLPALQFAPGDVISPDQMHHAFFTVMQNVPDPTNWSIRPQSPEQVERIRPIEGHAPIVSPNAPFRGVEFQPLTAAVAYGTLRFVPASELRTSGVGPRDIVLTDQVPNDIPLIGGLITEALQTPLAHVNILSRGRGTPNMALVGARQDIRIAPHLNALVRLEVTGSDFMLSQALPEDALAFWESRRPDGPPMSPRMDLELRGVQALEERSLADLPALGGKAAQLAELGRVALCQGVPVSVPDRAFAIPILHSHLHFEFSGARSRLMELRSDARFLAEPEARERGLSEVRALIQAEPIDPELLDEVMRAVDERWPGAPLRFRSSSNAEDLPGFSGAGLYESVGLDGGEGALAIADAIRTVWASAWKRRAYDERDYYNVNQDAVAMAVLVHAAFRSERINGVAISRDVLEPTRGDRQYFNVQLGEALVTNPAPGVKSEQFTYQPGGYVPVVYHDRSSFSPELPLISLAETALISCNLEAIERHFRPLIDPAQANPWFAMDIEFKLMGPTRALAIKQARPYSFGQEAPIGWCDF